MSKSPAFQFYPSDWQRDLDDYPLEIEGAWIRICCRLYWTGGTATKTLDEWCRILRENKRKTLQIFDFFLAKNICDLDNQNGSITITSRRMVRDAHIRKIRIEAGKMGGNPSLKRTEKELKNTEVLLNQNEEQKPTPSSSSSKRTPYSPPKLGDECDAKMEPPTPNAEPSPLNSPSPNRRGDDYDKSFLAFWQAYPRRVGKGAAWKAWKNAGGNRPPLESLLNALALQRASPDWNRDGGKFIPHPATWLNQRRWEDEIEAPKVKNGWK